MNPFDLRRVKAKGVASLVVPTMFAPVDLHQSLKRHTASMTDAGLLVVDRPEIQEVTQGAPLDWNVWLKFCAPCYDISPDVNDYVLFPAQIMISDLPNRNTVGFPLKVLTAWHRDAGMPAYRLWRGQPTFVEHDNKDHRKASGVIIDVALRKLVGYGTDAKPLYKLLFLMAVDRTKNPTLATAILKKEYGMVSMGAYVDGYSCSVCNAELGRCSHLNPNAAFDFYINSNNELVFRQVFGITPFECSVVDVGAFPTSTFQQTIDVRTGDVIWNDR